MNRPHVIDYERPHVIDYEDTGAYLDGLMGYIAAIKAESAAQRELLVALQEETPDVFHRVCQRPKFRSYVDWMAAS